jgi:hypothetical protein
MAYSQAEQRHSYDLHQSKLATIKPSVDCGRPQHWSPSKTNGKRAGLKVEQATAIEKASSSWAAALATYWDTAECMRSTPICC